MTNKFQFLNNLLLRVHARPELLILLLMIVIISMLVVPLPTFLVDFLIALNIVLAVLVFMGSFYIERILAFSTFPAVLLITTLFRLALSISTSRLILIDADAGEIISTFGQFVISDSLVVGFVVFSIVTIVQFIVITKGSERVAEVAARFSLDGMPGKQMSIDADLRAGIIDAEAARERRTVLERESQLYGSFDGAMKFIKGDAIAGIIIIFVNLIGGIAVGMNQHGMSLSEALSVFTILTIGDGLVAQIPALLIAIGAGFIVTHVSGAGSNIGSSITMQLFSNPYVLLVTAFLAMGIGLLPGFPFWVFLLLAMALGTLYIFKFHRPERKIAQDARDAEAAIVKQDANESGLTLIDKLDQVVTETIPLIIQVSQSRYPMLESQQFSERLRSQFFLDYGIRLPNTVLRASDLVENDQIFLLVNEVRAGQFQLYFDLVRVVNASEEATMLASSSVFGADEALWVSPEDGAKLALLGYQTRSALDEFYHCLVPQLAFHITEYFGIQDTKQLLDQMESKYPDLVKEVLRYSTVQRIAEIIQRLINERISVRNMKLVMEALALWGPREKDVINLVEHVRGSMARYICHKFSYNNELNVVVVSSQIEETIRRGIRVTSSGTFLNLEPSVVDELMDRFTQELSNLGFSHKDVVLLTAVDIRRFFKKLLESRFRDLDVISFGELTDSVSVNVIKTV